MTLYEFHHSCGWHLLWTLGLEGDGLSCRSQFHGKSLYKNYYEIYQCQCSFGANKTVPCCGSDLLNSIVSAPQRSLVVLVTRVNMRHVDVMSASHNFSMELLRPRPPLLRPRHPLSNVKLQTFNEDLNNRWHIVNERQCSIPFYSVTNYTSWSPQNRTQLISPTHRLADLQQI